MPARKLRKRLRGTKPRTHLSAPFRRVAQAVARIVAPRRRSRPVRA
jgi:hypothetical protein